MKAQQYEDCSNLRIKFASIDIDGSLVRDSANEYETLFAELPDEWSILETDVVQSRRADANGAWLLGKGAEEELAAVEHETGVEFLLAVGASVASTAIIQFVSWAWKRWCDSRKADIKAGMKVEPSFVLELVEDRFPNGQIRRTRKLEIYGPVEAEAIASAMRELA